VRTKNNYPVNDSPTIYNFLSALYFGFFSPYIFEISLQTVKRERVFYPWLGIILIVFIVLETYAFPKKMKLVKSRLKARQNDVGMGVVLWVFHTVISVSTVFVIFKSFGTDIKKSPTAFGFLIFIMIIKELYLLMFIIIDDDEEKKKKNDRNEWGIDLILLFYSWLSYTVIWKTIAHTGDMQKDNTGMYILNIIIVSIMFLIFYMPLRIPYYTEEVSRLKTGKDRLKFTLSIFIVLISVIVSL